MFDCLSNISCKNNKLDRNHSRLDTTDLSISNSLSSSNNSSINDSNMNGFIKNLLKTISTKKRSKKNESSSYNGCQSKNIFKPYDNNKRSSFKNVFAFDWLKNMKTVRHYLN